MQSVCLVGDLFVLNRQHGLLYVFGDLQGGGASVQLCSAGLTSLIIGGNELTSGVWRPKGSLTPHQYHHTQWILPGEGCMCVCVLHLRLFV